ncbi:MAG: hypothetical protein ACXV2C_07585 [Candidatus Bathyarchaeia archaeon]
MSNQERNDKQKRYPCLIGKKFEKLTVISRAENSNARKRRWNCICDCGNKTTVVSSHLTNGVIRSCGCLQREAISNIGKTRLDDLTGARFSRLLVICQSTQTKDRKPAWLCRCDCGNEKTIRAVNLRNGQSTSCGCYKLELNIKQLTKHGKSRTSAYINEKNKRRHNRLKHDPVYSTGLRIRGLIRKSIEGRGFRKETPTHKILGCNYDELRSHIESQFKDGMCWERFGEIHIDHIIPMASAKTIEDVLALNHYTNLQPLWAIDNLKKGATMPIMACGESKNA